MTINIYDYPVDVNLLVYVSLALLATGIIALLVFIFNRISGAPEDRWVGARFFGFMQSTFKFTFILIWIFAAAAISFLALFIQSYQGFTNKELVAVVQCLPSLNVKKTMLIDVQFIKDGEMKEKKTFTLKGDQWALEGDILKWDDKANFLGINTMYKLTRVRGRYTDVQEEIEQTPTVYSLSKGEDTEYWKWLYEYGHKLPFVTAVYGNTVYTYPSNDKKYEIYVTTSGFMAQPVEEPQPQGE